MAARVPTISVIMPAYKAEAFVARAIASVQAQTFGDWELVVVNDASPDATAAVVEKLAATDTRIRLISHAANGGESVARNTGIDAARGEWVAILDADDAYVPTRLATMMAAARDDASLDAIADNQVLWDGVEGRTLRVGLAMAADVPWTLAQLYRNDRPGRSFYLGWMKPTVKRAFLNKHKIRYTPAYRYGADFLFAAQVLAHGAKAMIVCEPGYIYTLPFNEITRKSSGMSQSKVDLKQIMHATDVLLQTHAAHLDQPTLAAIAARQALLADNQALKDLLASLKARDLRAVLALLCGNLFWLRPQMFYRLRMALWTRVLRRPRRSMKLVA
jgi:succinoglycan biosynthesis protein ExoO